MAGPDSSLRPEVLLAVLLAALMHAGWNALIRGAPDKALFTVLLHLCSALLALVALPFVGLPHADSAPYLAASVLLHMVYIALLTRAYDGAQLAVSYLFMRGLAPLLVCLVSVTLLGETLSMASWLGLAGILLGVLLIAAAGDQAPGQLLRQRAGRAALLNAVFIAAYTLVDGQGARLSRNALGYALSLALLEPILIVALQLRRRPQALLQYARQHWPAGVAGAAVATSAYGIVMWAMTQAPIALVAALRETSVVFAVLIGSLCFNEGRLRVGLLAAAAVVAGVLLLRI